MKNYTKIQSYIRKNPIEASLYPFFPIFILIFCRNETILINPISIIGIILMLSKTPTPSSTLQDFSPLLAHSSHHSPDLQNQSYRSIAGDEEQQLAKNRKWSEEEHMLYLLFLEENREKIKSKLIRRSNNFFREMAAFIGSKNGTQCRSYHQKYEMRYKYPHRIIRQEKEKVDQNAMEQLRQQLRRRGQLKIENQSERKEIKAVKTQEYECQTVIQGIQTIILHPNPQEKHNTQYCPFPLINFPVNYHPYCIYYPYPL